MELVLSLSQLPRGIHRTFVKYLQEGDNYNSAFVVGNVVHIYPHYMGAAHVPNTARIKVALEEPETGKKFFALIFGLISHCVARVNLMSQLVLSGFQTELPNQKSTETGDFTEPPVPLLVLECEESSRCRIWEVLQIQASSEQDQWPLAGKTTIDGVDYFSLNERFTVTQLCNFYAVVRDIGSVDKKSNSVVISIADPTTETMACRVKGCRLKASGGLPVEVGDILRVRNANVLSYTSRPRAVVGCSNVTVFKVNLWNDDVQAVSGRLNITSKPTSQEEDIVLRLARWSAWQELRTEKEAYAVKAMPLPAAPEGRPANRLSCLAELHAVDVACVVVAVHRAATLPGLVFVTVWDGTRPGALPSPLPSTLPTDATPVRCNDMTWKLLQAQLVSVCVARPWSRLAEALPLGVHVRFSGLTVRRGAVRWWVVLETRYSKRGLTVLTSPCSELEQCMEVVLALANDINTASNVSDVCESDEQLEFSQQHKVLVHSFSDENKEDDDSSDCSSGESFSDHQVHKASAMSTGDDGSEDELFPSLVGDSNDSTDYCSSESLFNIATDDELS